MAGSIADVSADEFDETVTSVSRSHASAVNKLVEYSVAYAAARLRYGSMELGYNPGLDPPVRDLGINLLYAAYESLKDYSNRKHEQNKDSKKTESTGNEKSDESHGSKVGDAGPTGKAKDTRRKQAQNGRWARQAGANAMDNASFGNKKNVQEASGKEHNAGGGTANALKRGTKRTTDTVTKVTSKDAQYHGDKDVFPKERDCAKDWITNWADQLDPKELTIGAQAAWLRLISQAPYKLTPQCKELWCRIITGHEGVGFRAAQLHIKKVNDERLKLGNSAYPLAGKRINRDRLLAVILREYLFWWKARKE